MLSNIKTSATISNSSTRQESYWSNHVKLKQSSGLSRVEYCRKNNLSLYQLKYQEHKLLKSSAAIKLLPIKLVSDEMLSKDISKVVNGAPQLLCKLKLKHGSTLKVYDINTLSIVLEVLK